MDPKISVVIPTYNDRKDIAKCLESLKNQTLKWGEDFEVIISDGHSTDGTDEIARSHGAKVVYEDVGTRGGACNVGAREARGEFIVFTDADAYFPRDWLEKILKEFEETGADVVGGDDILGDDATEFEKLLFMFDVYRGNPRSERDVVNRLRGVNTAYKKEVFFDVGGFNPSLVSVEETEMHWRIYEKGYRLVYDPTIFVYHHRRRDIKSLIKQMIRNGIGRINAIKKRPGMISLMDIAPFAAVAVLLSSVLLSIFLNLLYPILAVFFMTIVYFLTKPLLIVLKNKNIRKYFHVFYLNLIRELSFSIGIIMGMFKSKKPGKKM